MHDLDIFNQLLHTDVTTTKLASFLQFLASQPFDSRLAFFGPLERYLKTNDPTIQKSLIDIYHGATGYVVQQFLEKCLEANDADNRRSAIRAFLPIVIEDPSRLCILLCHCNPDVRREALELIELSKFPAWLLLIVLRFQSDSREIRQNLLDRSLPSQCIPTILAYQKTGIIDRTLARRLLVRIPWTGILAHRSSFYIRSPGISNKILSMAMHGKLLVKNDESPDVDMIEEILELFWDDQSAQEKDAVGLSPRQHLFANIQEDFLRYGFNTSVLAAILVLAFRAERWIPEAANLMVMFWPQFVLFPAVPTQVRLEAVLHLHNVKKEDVEQLDYLPHDFCESTSYCRNTDGSPNLYRIAALLKLAPQGSLVQMVRHFTLPMLVRSFANDPEYAVSILTIDNISKLRDTPLFHELEKHFSEDAYWQAANYCLDATYVLPKADNAQTWYARVLSFDRILLRPEFAVKSRTTRRIVEKVIGDYESDYFATALQALSQELHSELASDLFSGLSMLIPTSDFLTHFHALTLSHQQKLIHWLQQVKYFNQQTEQALATSLLGHEDAFLQRWAEENCIVAFQKKQTFLTPIQAAENDPDLTMPGDYWNRLKASRVIEESWHCMESLLSSEPVTVAFLQKLCRQAIPCLRPVLRRLMNNGYVSKAVLQEFLQTEDGSTQIGFLLLRFGKGNADLISPTQLLNFFFSSSEEDWLTRDDISWLIETGLSQYQLANQLITTNHYHGYGWAIDYLTSQPIEANAETKKLLRQFLEADGKRTWRRRLQVAEHLLVHGDFSVLPLLTVSILEKSHLWSMLKQCDSRYITAITQSLMMAGHAKYNENELWRFLKFLGNANTNQTKESLEFFVRYCVDIELRNAICRDQNSDAKCINTLIETYLWGINRSIELFGRSFRIKPATYPALAYTRFDEDAISVSAHPILNGERNGEKIVKGMIFHELGHHLYHRGVEPEKMWSLADQEGLLGLMNLVADEHLERGLRIQYPESLEFLQALRNYAFQHSQREISLIDLLHLLQNLPKTISSANLFSICRKPGYLTVSSRKLFKEMETQELSFSKFCRLLRMGLGGRASDPKITEALSLFKKNFHQRSMSELLEVARELKRIFGAETNILRVIHQDGSIMPGDGSLADHGDGWSAEDLRRELLRLANVDSHDAMETKPTGSFQPWLNVSGSRDFPQFSSIRKLKFDRSQSRNLKLRGHRHIHHLRRVFETLGFSNRNRRLQVRGRTVDSTRLPSLLLHNDPRCLKRSVIVPHADLFFGLLVDSSSSMDSEQGLEKAKLFATILAEAAKGLAGIELRIFGFNHTTLFDAGDAQRCAIHALQADGENNDAGALDHMARIALISGRRQKIIVMISDGVPTACSVTALRTLVHDIQKKRYVRCVQVAVKDVEEICFPHYIRMADEIEASVHQFAKLCSDLIHKTVFH